MRKPLNSVTPKRGGRVEKKVFQEALQKRYAAKAGIPTPGPWESYRWDVVCGADGAYVAGTQADFRSIGESAANCRLIAAAPDLLEALKLLTEEGDPRGAVLARVAIAKAEGKQ